MKIEQTLATARINVLPSFNWHTNILQKCFELLLIHPVAVIKVSFDINGCITFYDKILFLYSNNNHPLICMSHYIDNPAFDMFYSVTGEGFAERHFVFSEGFIDLSVGIRSAVL